MAFRVSANVALLIVFSLMAVAHCVPHEAELATDASAAAVTAAEVDAVSDGEGLLLLPYSDDSVVYDAVSGDGEVPGKEVVVEPVAEPDPDRSHLDSDGEEELTAMKLATEGQQQDDEKTKKQIDGDEDEDEEEEEEKTRKNNHGGVKEEKKKRKKHHDCDGKEKKKTKGHHKSNDEEEEEEEKTKKKIQRHHHVRKTKTKKLTHHNKNDSDDEEEQEKKEKRWRKAISRSMFGHGRRSQREEAAKEEVNN
ncbi:hypothetical protein PAHAL_1G119800 [Panicum hallii]|jgi:hypothetical protein|uniref:Uncharacterized protein n=1 Tax=Panicum hallii TaxID=206008 RepID=A0A2T8KV23_9POAL|nr:ABC transporter F family member 4-like [Panicum hallii]PVH65989.1 hypothetical protein PAHAL_1G119800 [Panicum hallii]